MQGFQEMSKKVLDNVSKSKAVVAVAVTSIMATASQAAITLPTADYTDIESAAAIGFGVVLTVGLLKKAMGFFK